MTGIAVFALFSFYLWKMHCSYKGWADGIGGKQLANDGVRCKVPFPTFVEYQIVQDFIDINADTPD